jgi:hypothetical protein
LPSGNDGENQTGGIHRFGALWGVFRPEAIFSGTLRRYVSSRLIKTPEGDVIYLQGEPPKVSG